MQWLNKLERKFGNLAIPNLMAILIFGMGLVFLLDTFTSANPNYEYTFSQLLYFDRDLIMQGQIWRIVTFLFLPPDSNILFVVFALYFYWLIGNSLEREWGSFRFNVYYFIGVIGTIIGGIITGTATNVYLNLSLFMGFSVLFPNFEILLFFFIPVKVKYLGMLDGALLLVLLVLSSLPDKIAILVSVLNFILFFGKGLIQSMKTTAQRKRHQKKNHWWKDDENNPWRK